MILPTPRLECECDLTRSMGALAVLRRRPAVITVAAECCACQECATEITGEGERDGWGSCAVGKGSMSTTVR